MADKNIIDFPFSKDQLLFGDGKLREAESLGKSIQDLKCQMMERGNVPRVGFTNGKFRFLHPAHCVFLSLCATRCNLLIVGINSDYSLRSIGEESVFSDKERAFALASLPFVHYVTHFDEETPHLCIQKLGVDVVFKGPDYSDKDVVSADVDVEIINHPFVDVHASDLEKPKRKFFDI